MISVHNRLRNRRCAGFKSCSCSSFAWTSFGLIPSGSWSTQLGSVANTAVFSYYDKSGTLLTGLITPSSVYRVLITVTVATKAASTRQYTYSTSASLRWEPE